MHYYKLTLRTHGKTTRYAFQVAESPYAAMTAWAKDSCLPMYCVRLLSSKVPNRSRYGVAAFDLVVWIERVFDLSK